MQTKTLEIKKYLSNKPTAVVFISLIVMLVIAEVASPGYLSVNNLSNVLRQASFLGIVAVGQTLVILTAGTDLSVSFLVTLGNVLSAQIMAGQNENVGLAIVVVIAVGLATGLVNGMGVQYLKVPSLVMTLGVGSVLQGIVFLYTKGAPKGNTAPVMQSVVSGKIFELFTPLVFVWIGIAAVTIFVLTRTVFGRNVYSVGENAEAAKYAGVPVARTILSVYAISGICASLTGLLLVGYTGTSYLDAGADYQMNSIAAVVLGGTLLSGGQGGYVGTIGGTLIICILMSVLNIIQIPAFGREIIRGLVIIVILMIFGMQSKRKLER